MDCIVHGVLQARKPEWVAILFFKDLLNPEIKPHRSLTLHVDSPLAEPPGKPSPVKAAPPLSGPYTPGTIYLYFPHPKARCQAARGPSLLVQGPLKYFKSASADPLPALSCFPHIDKDGGPSFPPLFCLWPRGWSSTWPCCASPKTCECDELCLSESPLCPALTASQQSALGVAL